MNLLPDDNGIPDYETQDDFACESTEAQDDAVCESAEEGEASSEGRIVVDISLQDMRVGECVEVFWSGENTWFEGEVTDVSVEDKQFEVYYRTDSQKLWHDASDYPVRMSC